MRKFEQLKRLYTTICNNNEINNFSEIYVAAITADFDRLFEFSWKTMKEYMFKELGMLDAKTGSPREVLGLAYNQGIIKQSDKWFSMLKDRNDDSHIYKKSAAILYKSKIESEYMPVIKELIDYLEELIPHEELESADISDELLDNALRVNLPVYQYVKRLSAQYNVSVEKIIDEWEEKYRFLVGEYNEKNVR